ncbi:hypothetical protein Runsl_5887 (plasmid) [Runella slithyformis DSM 19594]|uniref:Uncharacterized protein n=1 Tax=Runella slithyformis (strain ATCC 29530 / DSM 19594 / LMG 11500 / NCIMB 11436 / LSU 4) TaxID=761193 RepID=A0A7U3ZRH3_RUNSL|nr:hypothetical protein Runsl_5887 [Runella slithyformis DSM 19594]
MYLNRKILKYLTETLSSFNATQFLDLYMNKDTLQF